MKSSMNSWNIILLDSQYQLTEDIFWSWHFSQQCQLSIRRAYSVVVQHWNKIIKCFEEWYDWYQLCTGEAVDFAFGQSAGLFAMGLAGWSLSMSRTVLGRCSFVNIAILVSWYNLIMEILDIWNENPFQSILAEVIKSVIQRSKKLRIEIAI